MKYIKYTLVSCKKDNILSFFQSMKYFQRLKDGGDYEEISKANSFYSVIRIITDSMSK